MISKFVGDYAWEVAYSKGWTNKNIMEFQTSNEINFFSLFFELEQRFIFNKSDAIIVPCNFLRKILAKKGVDMKKVFLIRNSVDLEEIDGIQVNVSAFKSKLELSEKVFLTIGRLVPWKGVKEVIKVFSEINKDFEEVSLIVVGNGPLRDELEEFTEEIGVRDHVIFTGSVSHHAAIKFMKISDILVLNSSYEGMSHVLLEAMACRLPVVTTNVGGNPEIITNSKNGFLINLGDKRLLKSVLLNLLQNKSLRVSLGREGRKDVSKFNSQGMLKKILRIFMFVLSKKS